MAFALPDLILEQTIREGFKALKNDPTMIDRIFANMAESYASKKYGYPELERIKAEIAKKDWSFVHTFHQVTANVPAVSIQLIEDSEPQDLRALDDYEAYAQEEIEDESRLVVVSAVNATAYNAITSFVSIDDSVDLSNIYIGLLFTDSANNTFTIVGGIDNTTGSKGFIIADSDNTPATGSGVIKTSITTDNFEQRTVFNNVQILLGVHSVEPLLTKYMYILVKFFILSRKADLTNRGLYRITFSGSDFTRNMEYEGDHVYTRFLTIRGLTNDSWRSDQIPMIDSVDVTVKVPKKDFSNSDLGLQNQTVQIDDDIEES